MSKVLKTMGKDDSLTIRVNDDSDSIIIAMESQSKLFNWIINHFLFLLFLDQDKFADYELRLMDLDSEHLGIPDTDYSCAIKMPSSEFSRICRDMSIMGDSVLLCTTKEGVKFSAKGDLGQGMCLIR
jgi:proliferating cell nuclear antigen